MLVFMQPDQPITVGIGVKDSWASSQGQADSRQGPGGPDSQSDGQLVSLVAAGDQKAAGLLIERYQGRVRRFLWRLTGRGDLADDLAQETFLRMLRYAGNYDPKYPLGTWLLTIARRLLINRVRHESRQVRIPDWDGLPDKAPMPHEEAARRDQQGLLRKTLAEALEQLTQAQRQAVVLFHQQGLTVRQAAEVMDVPVGTVKSHLHRGRAAMRKYLTPIQEKVNPT